MSTNTLETAYVNGQIIDASHINELTLALLGEFVGRDANGIPTPGQSLGTLAIPWDQLYANGIVLNGQALDVSTIVSNPNRIVSGATRSLSSMPDYLRADGSTNEFNILGDTTDLVLSINNTAVSVNTDLNVAGITLAPSTNNTADINDADMTNDLYAGEVDSGRPEIKIDAVGSEITNRVGQVAAFLTPAGEVFRGLIKDSTTITNVYRGWYLDSSGNAVNRGNLSNNDTVTILQIGWVFVEDNGSTVDITYNTPTIAFSAPNSPATGDYWLDLENKTWKRYSGASWEIINRTLIGEIVSDDTSTLYSRSLDFSNNFNEINNVDIELFSTEIAQAKYNIIASIYGTQIEVNIKKLSWNITTDLESGQSETSETFYWLYLSDEGEPIISSTKPHFRPDLKGYYHTHQSWRSVGNVYNDVSNDLTFPSRGEYNSELREAIYHLSFSQATNAMTNLVEELELDLTTLTVDKDTSGIAFNLEDDSGNTRTKINIDMEGYYDLNGSFPGLLNREHAFAIHDSSGIRRFLRGSAPNASTAVSLVSFPKVWLNRGEFLTFGSTTPTTFNGTTPSSPNLMYMSITRVSS